MTLNVELIAETFNRAKTENGGARALGLSFYARLFEKYPQVRPLFTTDVEEQHKKLMASVGAIVASVTQPEKMLPYLHAMGIRHNKYQTEAAHYPAVKETLVAVLGEHLSVEGEWTEEMKVQWETAMQVISDIMIQAAENPAQFELELAEYGYFPNGERINSATPWELVTA